jgi:hypothetical protein
VAGTWKVAPDQQPTGNMQFGAMSLCHDGTFTAEAKYQNRSVVMTGWYCYKDDQLKFKMDDPEAEMRTYGAHVEEDTLVMTHGDTSVKLRRLEPCCGKCGKWECSCKKCKKDKK